VSVASGDKRWRGPVRRGAGAHRGIRGL